MPAGDRTDRLQVSEAALMTPQVTDVRLCFGVRGQGLMSWVGGKFMWISQDLSGLGSAIVFCVLENLKQI